jgi:release factor glutamine methyltransferase
MDREEATRALALAGCVFAKEEADELIRVAGNDAAALDRLVLRRVSGEPLAWITGEAAFCGLAVRVVPNIYVPRAHTELIASRACELLPAGGTAVDLCTGSGAIAMVMMARRLSARVVATDIDAAAVECARSNGVEVFQGFLDDPLPATLERGVDVMTAVVPYVPTGDVELLPRDVREREPRLALDGGPDGTRLLVGVIRRAPRWLREGGWLLLELGGDQADAIAPTFAENGFDALKVISDEDGDVRGVCARLGNSTTAPVDRIKLTGEA